MACLLVCPTSTWSVKPSLPQFFAIYFCKKLISVCCIFIVGSGSYGNGAAMRVAPVALFEKEEDDVIKVNMLSPTSQLE